MVAFLIGVEGQNTFAKAFDVDDQHLRVINIAINCGVLRGLEWTCRTVLIRFGVLAFICTREEGCVQKRVPTSMTK